LPHADYDPIRNLITVATVWSEKDLIRSVSGAGYRDGAWRVPATWASLVTLRGVFKETLTLGETLVSWAWELRRARVDPALEVRALLEWPVTENLNEHLYPFQRAGVEFMLRAGSGLIGDEMGTGKSIQLLSMLRARLHRGEPALPALIICPNSVKRHWVREIDRWLPGVTAYNVEGGAVQRRKVLKSALHDPTAVVIINIESVRLFTRLAPYGAIKLKRCRQCDKHHGDEGLTAARCDVHHKELNDFEFRTVALDEAHRVKEPKSQQTRAIWHVMHQASVRYRWALTGTPIANHPGDLWSVMHAVAPDDFPTRSQFIERYCLSGWNAYGALQIVGIRPDTRDELFKLLDPRFRRMLKAVVLPQLPPKVRQTRYVDMSTAQARMYGELDKSLITRLPDGELLIAPTQLAAQVRLMQVASTSVKITKPDPDRMETWSVTLVEPSTKLDALEEVLDERGVLAHDYAGPAVLIAAEFRQLIDLAARRLDKLGIHYALITGDVSPHDRERALDALRARSIRALLFTNKAGGVGLDMSASDTLINLQRSWSLVDESQKENRNHRIGSEMHECVNIIDIVMKGTVEEVQVTRLHEKLERLDEITRDRAALLRANVNADTTDLDALEALILNTPIGLPSVSEE
jgi:SNF2 family DNA or RNA helicase